MKRSRDRSINIFSMSALDLFASAMGAFIVISLILFQYYQRFPELAKEIKVAERSLGECEVKNKELAQQIQGQRDNNSKVEAGLKGCIAKLKKTFLTVVMKWESLNSDVDLIIVDAEQNNFNSDLHNRQKQHFPNTPAKLHIDTIYGPGIEIWEHPEATLGVYGIWVYLRNFGNKREPVAVRNTLYARDGVFVLPTITVRGVADLWHVINVVVDEEGTITLQRATPQGPDYWPPSRHNPPQQQTPPQQQQAPLQQTPSQEQLPPQQQTPQQQLQPGPNQ